MTKISQAVAGELGVFLGYDNAIGMSVFFAERLQLNLKHSGYFNIDQCLGTAFE